MDKLSKQTDGEIFINNLPLIGEITSEGSLGPSGQWWFDPNGKFYSVELPAHNHTEWIQQNAGIDNINGAIEKGWIRACKYGDKSSIYLESLQNIPDFITDFILKLNDKSIFIEDLNRNYINVLRKDVIEQGVQKAVNIALQQKRLGSLEVKSELRGWLSPEGKFYKVNNHADWALEHAEEVGLDVKSLFDSDPETEEQYEEQDWENIGVGLQNELIGKGWSRIGDIYGGKGYGIEISDLYNIPSVLFNFLLQHPLGDNVVLENTDNQWVRLLQEDIVEGQKAVNKALSHKRLQTASLNKIYTRDELERMDIDDLDRMAYGHASGEIIQLKPSQIRIQYPVDLSNPEYKFEQQGMAWVNSVDLSEPVKVSIKQNGKFYLEDGHHRWFAAKKLGLPLMAEIEVKAKPIETILQRQEAANSEQNLHASLKQAFLKEAFGEPKEAETDICVDLDKIIAQKAPFPAIGEPIEGAKEASLCITAYRQQKLWIDPSGKEYKVETVHADWILEHADTLKKQYGWKNTKPWKFEDDGEIYDYEGLDSSLISMGWSRIGDIDSGWGIEVADLRHIPECLMNKLVGSRGEVTFEDVNRHYVIVDVNEFVTNGQKAVNRALQKRRLQPAFSKKDLNKIAYERHGAYWVDPSGKVYPVKTTHEDWFFENEQLLRKQYRYDQDEIGQDWWDIKTGNLLKQLLEDGWLRVGDLFAAGRKSIGTGIEIANLSSIPPTLIDFVANWGKDKYFQIEDLQRRVVELSVEELVADGQEAINKALQQERMLSRRGSFDLPVIDPKTYPRKESYALFIGTQWDTKHTVGVDLFNIYPMINADNGVPTVGLQTLVDKNIPIIGKESRAGDKQPAQDISGLYKQAKAFSKKEITAEKSSLIEYACVMADIPKEISQEIVEFGVRNIKDEDIYMKDGLLGRELDSHITIKYGIISDDSKQVEKLFKGIKQFKATLGEVKHFSPEGREFDVLIVSVESKDLSDMNEEITKELKCATGLPSDEYHPHITIAYIKKDTCKDLYGNKEFVGKEITIDSVEFSPVEGDKTSIELGNKKEAAYRGNMSLWLAPDGQEYQIKSSHDTWLMKNRTMIFDKYKIDIDARDEHDKVGWMIQQGWVRIDGYLPVEVDLNVADINNISQAAEQFVWKYKPEMVIVEDLNHKDTSFDREEYSKGMMKHAKICYTYKIGDKVRDRSNGKMGIIKEINGKEVILEELV